MIVRTSIGGRSARVQFSNAFGAAPLVIGGAHIARRGKDSAIMPGSDRALTFHGKPSGTIPPGAWIVSDPVDLRIPQLSDLAISVYLPGEVNSLTMHATGLHTTYITKGDATGQPTIPDAATSQSWYFLSSVDVLAPADTRAIVAFGDSITDGARSTPDADRSWPSVLAQQLLQGDDHIRLAVVNQGISGNRVLRDGAGVNALARFDRDVLSVSGVRWLVLLESINDIGNGMRQNASPNDAVTTDDLIGGLQQLAERAHMHGIRVIGGTLLPYEGAAYYSEAGEVMRQAVNGWIRTTGVFDAVVDFDSITRDKANPKHLREDADSGDHLHPSDAGYKAMAEAVAYELSPFVPQARH
jgi:lysophospholipase L1-like esterase